MNLIEILNEEINFNGSLDPLPFNPLSFQVIKIPLADFVSQDFDLIILFLTNYIKECCAILNLTCNVAHMSQKLAIHYLVACFNQTWLQKHRHQDFGNGGRFVSFETQRAFAFNHKNSANILFDLPSFLKRLN